MEHAQINICLERLRLEERWQVIRDIRLQFGNFPGNAALHSKSSREYLRRMVLTASDATLI